MINPLICSGNPSINTTQYILLNSNKLLERYKQLIDSYVLDFFTCSHWDILPKSWKIFFKNISPEDLEIFLNLSQRQHCRHHLMPLEILCLRVLIRHLSIPRYNLKLPKDFNELTFDCAGNLYKNDKIEKLLWKCIKMKKRHEIKSFAQIIHQTAKRTNCSFVVDVGSGLGHLSRLLTYGYDLKVCGIECNEKLSFQARKLDNDFEKQVSAYDKNFLYCKHTPVHVNYSIKSDISNEEFAKIISDAFENDVDFGVVGLHPCGDLGPTLLRLYKTCPNIRFINVVGCCYMKLTTLTDSSYGLCGYPMSKFAFENEFHLAYNAREIACHAMETYLNRLKSGQHWQLKVHSYRAAIEYVIVQEYPQLRHSPLSNVKYQANMDFNDYCSKALKNLNLKLTDSSINSETVKMFLDDWRSVVTFYTIRLLFAPLVESVILLDRYLYLKEAADGACLTTVFDPLLSPRNHVLLGIKTNMLT